MTNRDVTLWLPVVCIVWIVGLLIGRYALTPANATPRPTTVIRIPADCTTAATEALKSLTWLRQETAAWAHHDKAAAFNAGAHVDAIGTDQTLADCGVTP